MDLIKGRGLFCCISQKSGWSSSPDKFALVFQGPTLLLFLLFESEPHCVQSYSNILGISFSVLPVLNQQLSGLPAGIDEDW